MVKNFDQDRLGRNNSMMSQTTTQSNRYFMQRICVNRYGYPVTGIREDLSHQSVSFDQPYR